MTIVDTRLVPGLPEKLYTQHMESQRASTTARSTQTNIPLPRTAHIEARGPQRYNQYHLSCLDYL